MEADKIRKLYNTLDSAEKGLIWLEKYLKDEEFRNKVSFLIKFASGVANKYSLPLFFLGFRVGKMLGFKSILRKRR